MSTLRVRVCGNCMGVCGNCMGVWVKVGYENNPGSRCGLVKWHSGGIVIHKVVIKHVLIQGI